MSKGSKLDPAALDAYQTAKPDEPTWSVQGGDPLGAPLLRVWATAARVQAGAISKAAGIESASAIIHTALEHQPDRESETEELLIRATQTERISWAMDEYRRGHRRGEAEIPAEKSPDVESSIELHEYRKQAASQLSNIFSTVNEIREDLIKLGADESLDGIMREAISLLRSIYNEVQPSEARKLHDPANW